MFRKKTNNKQSTNIKKYDLKTLLTKSISQKSSIILLKICVTNVCEDKLSCQNVHT